MLKKLSVMLLVVVIAMSLCVFAQTPNFPPVAEGAVRVEAEWFNRNFGANTKIESRPDCSGDCFVGFVQPAAPSDPMGYYMSYDVYMQSDAIYEMEFRSTRISDGTDLDWDSEGTYLSPFSISVNGSAEFRMDNKTAMKVPESVTGSFCRYKVKVGLKAGKNTITFHVRDERGSKDGYRVFYLDYMDFKMAAPLSTAVRVEGEDFLSCAVDKEFLLINQNPSLSGGKAVFIQTPAEWMGTNLKYNVFMPYEGNYNLDVASVGLGSIWSSDYDCIINGTKYHFDVNSTSDFGIVGTSGGNNYKKYTYNSLIPLKEGLNTVEFVTTEFEQSMKLCGFDYFEFKPFDTAVLEGESIAPIGAYNKGEMYPGGGQYLAGASDVSALPLDLNYTFMVPETGAYDVFMDIGANVGSALSSTGFLTTVEYSFDGINFQKLNAGTAEGSFKDGNLTYLGAVPNMPAESFGSFKMSVPVTLNAGKNTLTLRLKEKGPSHSQAVFYFDKAVIVPPINLGSAKAVIQDSVIIKGNTSKANVYTFNTSGILMDNNNFRVTYGSSDERILTVNAIGEITAKNVGSANVEICVTDDVNPPIKIDKKVKVSSDGQKIVVVDSKIVNNKAIVSVASLNGQNQAFKLIGGLYGYEAGNTTSLREVQTANVDNLKPLIIKDVELGTYSNYTNAIMQIFSWDDLDNMQPISDKNIISEIGK